jgi:hypothetical protein
LDLAVGRDSDGFAVASQAAAVSDWGTADATVRVASARKSSEGVLMADRV